MSSQKSFPSLLNTDGFQQAPLPTITDDAPAINSAKQLHTLKGYEKRIYIITALLGLMQMPKKRECN
jgi:hypothetical protein